MFVVINLTIYFFLQKKKLFLSILWKNYLHNLILQLLFVQIQYSAILCMSLRIFQWRASKNYECWLCITIRKIWKNTKLDKWTREHSVNKFSKMNNRKMPLKFKHNFVWYFTTFGISFWHKFRFNDFYDRI